MVRIKDHGYVTALREIKHLKSGIRKVKHKPHNSKRKPGATPHTEKDHLKRMNRELERLNRKVKSSKSEIETLEKKLKLADAARLRSEKEKRKMEAQNERHCLLAKRCMRETIRLRTTYHLDSDDEASTSDDSEIEQHNRLNRRAVSLRHQPIAKEVPKTPNAPTINELCGAEIKFFEGCNRGQRCGGIHVSQLKRYGHRLSRYDRHVLGMVGLLRSDGCTKTEFKAYMKALGYEVVRA